mmetsp:Transcript_60068/g.130277  ORF Transcript_60068/g.130277 Transcript_60068/m.130277 type:complete len:303 (-) Transcript_60068:22-930(-)
MGRFAEEAAAQRRSLAALQGKLGRIQEILRATQPVFVQTASALCCASQALAADTDAAAEAEATDEAIASRRCGKATPLESLRAASLALHALGSEHEGLLAAFAAVPEDCPKGSAHDVSVGAGDQRGRWKSTDARGKAKAKSHIDLSAFTKARWEAERLKGASMFSAEEPEPNVSMAGGIKVFLQETPKPFQPEKLCTQVKGRHIMVNTAEKARKVYIELSVSGNVDRVGFVKAVNLQRFIALATDRSDCPSAKRGGDLGWISKGSGDPKLEEVAFATPRGACSPPFKVANFFHIVFCEERKG